jgi:hypothetical protein
MKQYIVTIPDNKVNVFIDMLKNTSYVNYVEDNNIDEIPEEHKRIVRERIKMSEKDPSRRLKWDDAKHKIKL